MATSIEATHTDFVIIKQQYLAMVPIQNLQLMNTELPEDQRSQLEILEKTILSPVAKKYPPSISYRRLFLKTLLKKFEASGIEVCDELYEEYTNLVAVSDGDVHHRYRTYSLVDDRTITIKESIKLISQGTTGLQIWPSAFCLAEWAMENKQLLAGKRIVELGCGLGLTGLIICRACHPSHYTFTDYHHHVLRTLQENIEINNIQVENAKITRTCERNLGLISENCETDNSLGLSENGVTDNSKDYLRGEMVEIEKCNDNEYKANEINGNTFNCGVTMEILDWQNVEALQKMDADVILAADVTYDTRNVPSLVNVLYKMLQRRRQGSSQPVAYIASSIRNEETQEYFLNALATHGIKMKECELASQQVFYYDASCPFTILQLTV